MLLVAAVAVAVIAFVIISPGGDEEPASTETTATAPATETTEQTETEPPPAETETDTETETVAPEPQVSVTRIQLQGGQVVGGPKTIEVSQGEQVRIAISSDAGDELHLHGYDITQTVEPGGRAVFNLKANLEGVFELESHVAEDAGRSPLVANLVVNPS